MSPYNFYLNILKIVIAPLSKARGALNLAERLQYSLFDGVCGRGKVYSLFDSREVCGGGTGLDIHFLTVGRSVVGAQVAVRGCN